MNFYDKVHELVRCLKETEEYKQYMNLKKSISQDERLTSMIKEFKEMQRNEQMKYINGGEIAKDIKQELQQKYSLIIQSPLAAQFFQAEIKLDVMLADMQKILGESLKDIIEF